MTDPLLIITADRELGVHLTATLDRLGLRHLSADDTRTARQLQNDNPDSVLLLDADLPEVFDLCGEIGPEAGKAELVVLAAPDQMERVMLTYRHVAADFLVKPVIPVALEIVIERIHTGRASAEGQPGAASLSAGLRMPETGGDADGDLFLAVRQVVDKMSDFIAQIAAEAQGGLRFFNELPYFVSIHDRDCRVLAANPTTLKYLGNRIGEKSWRIYAGKCSTRNTSPVGRTLSSGDVLRTRALVRYRSGARVPVIVHTAPIYDDEGRVHLVLEIFAGSKEIEALAGEIGRTQQRYRQLFDAVPSYIAVTDRRLRITACNRRFQEGLGDQTGRNFFEVLRPGSFPAFRDPITQTVKDGQPQKGEMVLTDAAGRQYNLTARTAPILTAAGKLVQVLVVFTDVTPQRRMQDNLSSLGLMVGTLAHNLKGVLTGLDAGLYMIESGFYRDQPGRIEEGLDVARMMADRVGKLAQNVLFYSKERALEIESTDPYSLGLEVAALMENRIRSADISFVCDLVPDSGRVEMDVSLVRSVLVNLLENAIDACLEDEAQETHRIDLRLRSQADHVEFEVQDDGTGIDPKQRSRIFSLFFTSKGSKGTGLGLFITRKVIRDHGGSVTVESEPGRGALFRIRLPRRVGK